MVVLRALSGAQAASLLLLLSHAMPIHALQLETRDDVIDTSKTLASDLIKFYHGNETGETVGLLPDISTNDTGYYWWQSGAFMSTYIDYWQLTGDETYNELVAQSVTHQMGENGDFMPANQTTNLANDDQAVWAMGAMTAAEYGFPSPLASDLQWLDLAVAVFNTQAVRWELEVDEDKCNGGLRWQIPFYNNGYEFKSAEANVFFFNLASRLARFTGNETYAKYAERAWTWMADVKMIDNEKWAVFGGAQVQDNCTKMNQVQRASAASSLAMGSAFMFNYTDGSSEWKTRVEGLTKSTLSTFFNDKGFFEVSCADESQCPRDLLSFKALVLRWLAVTTQVAPFTADSVFPVLRISADNSEGKKEGEDAMEKTMGALAAVSNLLIPGPYQQGPRDKSGNGSGNDGSGSSNDSRSSDSEKKTDKSSDAHLSGFSMLALTSSIAMACFYLA